MNTWLEIFKAGEYPGKVPVTVDDLRFMAAAYDPAKSDAPLVLGHPDTDSPAHGWVERLRVLGDTLWAKARDVSPELTRLVKSRAFQHISMAVFPNWQDSGRPYLRHVGFLGAATPAVKGMQPVRWADAKFDAFELPIAEALDRQDVGMRVLDGVNMLMERLCSILCDEGVTDKRAAVLGQVDSLRGLIEAEQFTEGDNAKGDDMRELLEKLRALFAEFEGKAPDSATVKVGAPGAVFPTFTEAQVQAREVAAADKARKDAAAEQAKAAERAARVAAVKARVAEFVAAGTAAGTYLPAWNEAGLPAALEVALLSDGAVTFAEGAAPVNAGEAMLAALGKTPKLVTFGEAAPAKTNVGTDGAGEKLEALTVARMKESKRPYNACFAEVQRENPELARQYAEEVAGGR